MNPWPERRSHTRLPLRLPVRFNKVNGSPAINSYTENISSEGFYCISPRPFAPGDCCEVDVSLPSCGTDRCGAVIRCQVRVVRADASGVGPRFGIGCHIENYTF